MSVKLSDVLWIAANEYLCHDTYKWDSKSAYSCAAVESIALNMYEKGKISLKEYSDLTSQFKAGAKALGLDTITMTAFSEFPPGPSRQEARYAWLMFCYDLAIEQGL